MSRLAALRATLRIARRDATRSRGRSALVVAMLALPVAGVVGIDVLARSGELDPDERIAREFGQADARYSSYGAGPILQRPDAQDFASPSGGLPGDEAAVDLPALLPPGSRSVTEATGDVLVRTDDGRLRVFVRELDYADPLTVGMTRVERGRAPATRDEVALSASLLTRTGLRVGDRLSLVEPPRSLTVVGVARSYQGPGEQLLALPGAVLTEPVLSHLVDSPAPVTWPQVMAANRAGGIVASRAVILDPPPRSEVPYYAQVDRGLPVSTADVAVLGVLVGMTLLEIVLLAGPAFAVGARRSRRQLALLAATGGESRHVRDVVLGGGLVLGLVGGLVGAALGIGAAAAAMPLIERVVDGQVFGRLDVRPLEVGGVVLVAVVTGLLAALLPARGAARQDVVAALAGRRGTVRSSRPMTALGVGLVAVGVALAAYGAVVARDTLTLVGGSMLAQLGLVALTPVVVGLVGRFGRWLPVTPRLALRDAARNRSRTAPAVAAVLAAVAGSSAIGVYVASLSAYDRANYTPTLRSDQAYVQLYGEDASDAAGAVATAGTRTLPVRDAVVVQGLGGSCSGGGTCSSVSVETPPANLCPLATLQRPPTAAEREQHTGDERCAALLSPRFSRYTASAHLPVVASGERELVALFGRADPAAVTALRTGGVVVFDRLAVHDGRATLLVSSYDPTGGQPAGPDRRESVPAAVVDPGDARLPGVLVSPAVAERLGVGVAPQGVLFDTTRMPTEAEEERAAEAVSLVVGSASLQVERGYQDAYGLGLLALVVGSAVITLGASGISTGLAAADGRADLATLAAVGATPRTRRVLAMAQAAVIAGLGALLGIAAGLVPGVALVRSLDASDRASGSVGRQLVIPWDDLALTGVVVPLLAALAAGLLTRSRLPLDRRLA